MLLAGLLAGSIQAQNSKLRYDRLLKSEGSAFYRVPLGLCEDYPEESTTLEIIRNDMGLLKRSGIDLLRISFGWDGIEGAKDEYDWLFWDDFVKMAVDEYGITLIPYIAYTPLWNSTNDDPNDSWHFPPKDFDEFGEFVFDLVTRYKDQIKSWELWNEPDIWIFWAGNHEQFAKLIQIGSEAVRRADPDAVVVLGGLAHDTGWLKTLFRDHDVSRHVDVVNMHNYYETWVGYPMEDIVDYIHTVDDIVQRYGDGQTLWMAEVGYSTYRSGSRVSDGYSAYYDYEHTRPYQAVDVVRRLTAALSTAKLSAIAWYEIKDLNPGELTIGDFENNGNLGVALATHEAKPAEHALAFFNRLTSEPMRVIDSEIRVTRAAKSDAHVHAFEQEDGDVLVVGWLQTMVPGTRGDVGEGDHVDSREEAVLVSIPRSLTGSAVVYDEMGGKKEFDQISRGADSTDLTLALTGGRVYILHISK